LGPKGANIKKIANECKACYIYLHVIDDYSLVIQVSAPYLQGFLQCRQMALDLINSVWISLFNVAVFWPTSDPTVEAALAAVTGTTPCRVLPQDADWSLPFRGPVTSLLDNSSPPGWGLNDVDMDAHEHGLGDHAGGLRAPHPSPQEWAEYVEQQAQQWHDYGEAWKRMAADEHVEAGNVNCSIRESGVLDRRAIYGKKEKKQKKKDKNEVRKDVVNERSVNHSDDEKEK